MEQSYLKAVAKKLKLRGLSDEEVAVEIKKITNPNYMEEKEEEVVVDEVNIPVAEEEVVEETPVVEEETVDTEEEVA